jgi:sarcosine oxidase subunit gamma
VGEDAKLFVSALADVAAGRHGKDAGAPGVTVHEVKGTGLASITARKDRRAALMEAIRSVYGIVPPDAPRHVAQGGMAFIWSGPDQWLAHLEPAPDRGMETALNESLSDLAAIVDQSHGRTLLQATGPHVRAALAKGLAIDLHPRAFKAGHAAVTAVAHIGVNLWQIDDAPTYRIAVPRGFASSFWHWLAASCAEFGLDFRLE